jgi:hypothetical protein
VCDDSVGLVSGRAPAAAGAQRPWADRRADRIVARGDSDEQICALAAIHDYAGGDPLMLEWRQRLLVSRGAWRPTSKQAALAVRIARRSYAA